MIRARSSGQARSGWLAPTPAENDAPTTASSGRWADAGEPAVPAMVGGWPEAAGALSVTAAPAAPPLAATRASTPAASASLRRTPAQYLTDRSPSLPRNDVTANAGRASPRVTTA